MKLLIVAVVLILAAAGCGGRGTSSEIKKAGAAAKAGDWNTALELAGKRLNDVPNDLDASVMKALALFHIDRTNPDKMHIAVNLLKQAVSLESGRYDLWLTYGWVLLNLGRTEEALEPLQRAYQLHIKSGKETVIGQEVQGMLKYALAKAYLATGKLEDARHYYEQAAKSTPFAKSECLHNDLGFIAYSIGAGKGGTDSIPYIKLAERYLVNAVKEDGAKRDEIQKLTQAGKPVDHIVTEENMCNIFANYGTICYYMSFPYYGGTSSTQYAGQVVPWYKYAIASFNAKLQTAREPAEQAQLRRSIAQMEKLVKKMERR